MSWNLTDEEREVVEIVAVGSPAPVFLVEEIVDVGPVDRAEDKGLITSFRGRRGATLVPSHPLYGEVLLEQLTEAQKQRICRRLVEAALSLREAAGVDPLRVAKWQLRSGVMESSEVAVTGASLALGRHDPRLAEELARSVSDRSTAGAILLGRSLSHQSRYEEAEQVMAEKGRQVTYKFGTMIELPRAALLADELAEIAPPLLEFGHGVNGTSRCVAHRNPVRFSPGRRGGRRRWSPRRGSDG